MRGASAGIAARSGSRAVALAAALLLSSCGSSTPPGVAGPTPSPDAAKRLTVVVVVVDSLMPEEINPATTPNLQALKDAGTFWPESRAVFSAETIPNHVAMMTGVYPDRNGIPANKFIDFAAAETEDRDLSLPEEMTALTAFTWLRERCVDTGLNPELRTGAVLSKKYLFEIFAGDAANPDRENDDPAVFNVQPDEYWDPTSHPAYLPDPDEHTPDAPTMQEVLARLPSVDFLFVNLGDVDRSAHAFGEVGRASVPSATDTQIGRLVTALQDAGRWERTVLIVVSDHGMDFSTDNLQSSIGIQPTLDQLAACLPAMVGVPNGGTNGVFFTDRTLPRAERDAALAAIRPCLLGDAAACTAACPGALPPANAAGIEDAWYVFPNAVDPANDLPTSLRSSHENLGDLVLAAKPGFKFAEAGSFAQAIVGNHGHPATFRSTMLISGGAPFVRRGVVVTPSRPDPGPLDRLPEQAENVDVAPTVLWLFGVQPEAAEFPDGRGFDGRVLAEAFSQSQPPSRCGLLSTE